MVKTWSSSNFKRKIDGYYWFRIKKSIFWSLRKIQPKKHEVFGLKRLQNTWKTWSFREVLSISIWKIKNFNLKPPLKQTSNSALFHRCHRVLSNKCHFWRRIRNRPENLPRNPFSIRLFNVVLRWHRFCQLSTDLKILGLNPIFSFFSVKQGFWARIRNQRQKSAEPSARIFSCTKVLVSLEIHHLKMDSEGWIDSVSKFFRGGEAFSLMCFVEHTIY